MTALWNISTTTSCRSLTMAVYKCLTIPIWSTQKVCLEERRLLHLYISGSAEETAAVVREALADISEPDLRTAAEGILRKLDGMSEASFECLALESEGRYAG